MKGKPLVPLVVWLCTQLAIPAPVSGRENVPVTTTEQVKELYEEARLEEEVLQQLVKEEEYQRKKKEERDALVEAMLFEVQMKRRKRFRQKLDFFTMFDSNIFHEHPPSHDQNTVFDLTPETQLDLGGKRVRLYLSYIPYWQPFTRFWRQSLYQQKLAPRAEIPIGKRTKLSGNYRLFRGKSRPTSETKNFSLRTENTAEGDLEHFFSRRFSVGFHYNHTARHFSDSDQDSNDSRSHWFVPRLSYQATRRTFAFIEFGLGRERGGNGRFNSTDLRVSMGGRGQFTIKSAFHLNLGVLRKNLSENPAFIDDFTGPFVELIHIWQTTPKLKMTTLSSFNTENSFFLSNSFFGTRYGRVDVEYEMVRRMKILSGIGIRRNKYASKSDRTAEGDAGQRSDYIFDGLLGVRYSFRKNFSLETSYRFEIVDSNFDPQDYRTHLLSLGFRSEF